MNESWSEGNLERCLNHLEHMAKNAIVSIKYAISPFENLKSDKVNDFHEPKIPLSDKNNGTNYKNDIPQEAKPNIQKILDDVLKETGKSRMNKSIKVFPKKYNMNNINSSFFKNNIHGRPLCPIIPS